MLTDVSTDALVAHMQAARRLEHPIRVAVMLVWMSIWVMVVMSILDFLAGRTFEEMTFDSVFDIHSEVLGIIMQNLGNSSNTSVDPRLLQTLVNKHREKHAHKPGVVLNMTVVVETTFSSALGGLAKTILISSSCLAILAGKCVTVFLHFPTLSAMMLTGVMMLNILL